MPKGSPELTRQRENQITDACAKLYETMSFKEITLKHISEQTSFTRTLIYYYFHTKEEIFLALLQREYEAWSEDLRSAAKKSVPHTRESLAGEIALSLTARERMLKLVSMNLYDMEANSRIENLISFKKAYGGSLRALGECIKAFFPHASNEDINGFLFSFFPFMLGIYPYTSVTEKQREALERSHAPYCELSVYQITKSAAFKLLSELCADNIGKGGDAPCSEL